MFKDIGEHENEMDNGNLGQWAMIWDKIMRCGVWNMLK